MRSRTCLRLFSRSRDGRGSRLPEGRTARDLYHHRTCGRCRVGSGVVGWECGCVGRWPHQSTAMRMVVALVGHALLHTQSIYRSAGELRNGVEPNRIGLTATRLITGWIGPGCPACTCRSTIASAAQATLLLMLIMGGGPAHAVCRHELMRTYVSVHRTGLAGLKRCCPGGVPMRCV
jgi:hypothetical protein